MDKEIKVLDLFSGAGGFSSGFVNEGYKLVGAIEAKSRYAKTHSKNFPDSITIDKDIMKLGPKTFSRETGIKQGHIDLIIGGPPCQTFSSIGTPKINSVTGYKLKEDPRNYLYHYYLNYVKFYKPKIFILENVPTMKTKYKGHLFHNLLNEIDKIKYIHYHSILNAVNYGVPQIRKRLFIIGFQDSKIDYKWPVKTHYGPGEEESSKNFKKFTTVKDAIDDLPIIYDGIREHHLEYSKLHPTSEFQKIMRNGSKTVGNNVCRMSNDRAKLIFAHMTQGDKYMDLPPEVRKILPFREDIFHDRLKRLSLDSPSWTVLAHIGMDGYMYIHPTETRTLSVREAARLQSFQDNFEFVGNMREQYIQVGNSVPPLLAQALAKSITPYLFK